MFTHQVRHFRLLLYSDLSCTLLIWKQIEQPSLKPDKVRCSYFSQYEKVKKWKKAFLEVYSPSIQIVISVDFGIVFYTFV